MPQQFAGNAQASARTVVITGGNSGLGFGCANAILMSPNGAPWHVILACRDKGRAQAAVEQLAIGAAVMGQVEAMSLDLASPRVGSGLRKRTQKEAEFGIDSVLARRGVQRRVNPFNTKTVTVDGFESTFGINHLGHFLLVNELLPALKPPARVVVVASGVHDPARKSGVPAPAWKEPAALARGKTSPFS